MFLRLRFRRPSPRVAVTIVGVAALTSASAIMANAAFSQVGARPGATLDQTTPAIDDRPAYDWTAKPLADSITVASVAAANGALPFAAVLPASAGPPARIYVSDPATTPHDALQLAAAYNDPKYGVFQVFEQPNGITESALEAWATSCNTCSHQEVATVGSTQVLILASPGHGISFSWLRNGVLRTIMGPELSLSRTEGLALVSDIVDHGG